MGSPDTSSSDTESRVVDFRRDRPGARSTTPTPAPVENLAKYQGGRETPADYRHRMIVNTAAFLFVLALIGAGLWLADTMASVRKNSDCVLSGRRGCSPVDVQQNRW